MKNVIFNDFDEILSSLENQKLKAYVINEVRKIKKEQMTFFDKLAKERKLDDLLSVNEITEEYGASRKTIYRWREKGLKVYQKTPCSNIRIKRADLLTFLKNTSYGR